jgi:hypothetical protein
MAGIPMYHGIPSFGEVEAKMAREKMDVLKTEEAQIQLDELKQAKDIIKKQAIDDLARTKTSQVPPSIPGGYTVGTGFDGKPAVMPEGAMSLQGVKSPTGTPMPSFMTGADTEARAKEPVMDETKPATMEMYPGKTAQPTIETQPATETQPVVKTPYQQVKVATNDYIKVNDQVNAAYKTAELFKQNGLLLQYQKQIKIAQDLENTRTIAQERRIDSAKKVLEVTGQIAQGYLDADPQNKDAAWGTALMQLNAAGIPIDDLIRIPPNMRDQVAQQYADSAISGANKLKLELEYLKESGRNRRAEESNRIREDLGNKRLQQQARNQEALQIRFDKSMELREFNAVKGKLSTIISQAQRDRNDIEAKSDDISFRINGLRSGTILTDKYGNKLTKEARIAEVTALQEDLNALDTQRKKVDEEIKGYESKLKEMPVPKGGSKETNTEASTQVKEDTASKPTPQDINLAVQAINQHPEALEQIKANWAKLHPDAKFEDYIKLNPNKANAKK